MLPSWCCCVLLHSFETTRNLSVELSASETLLPIVDMATERLFFVQLMLMSYCVAELLLLFVVELFRKHERRRPGAGARPSRGVCFSFAKAQTGERRPPVWT